MVLKMRTCFYEKNLIGLLYNDMLADVCILYNLTLFYSISLIYFFWAATAFDIFGTDNVAEELLTCGFQYPSLQISILYFVARIFGCKLYNFALLNAGESGKHQNVHAFLPL
jgi:hypothetical protein